MNFKYGILNKIKKQKYLSAFSKCYCSLAEGDVRLRPALKQDPEDMERPHFYFNCRQSTFSAALFN